MKKERLKRLAAGLLCLCMAGSIAGTQLVTAATSAPVTHSLTMGVNQQTGAMFRWWVPAALPMKADRDTVRAEVEDIAAKGFAGIEISVLMGEAVYDQSDLGEYGWGSDAWIDMLCMLCEIAEEHNLKVDVTATCSWPISLPEQYAFTDYDASEKNLFEGDTAKISGATEQDPTLYSDKKENYNHADQTVSRKLQAVTAAKVVSDSAPVHKGEDQFYVWGSANIPGRTDGSENALVDEASLLALEEGTDYTYDEETGSVTINWRPEDGSEYTVFTYWMGFSGATSKTGMSETAYYTDYMSKDGANAYIAFWEEKLLSNERLSGLIDKVGMSIFEDSLEFGSYFGADNLEWSATFLEKFEQRAGYDLTPYLPLLNGQSMGGSTNVEYYDYEFGVYNEETGEYEYDDAAERIRKDLAQVITELFDENHIAVIQDWAHQNNMTYRMQAYSFDFDTAYLSSIVDYPDVETVGFFDMDKRVYTHGYDKSRIVSAGAHMGGKNIISSECGAVNARSYRLTWPELFEYTQLQYALGANRMIFHGYSHTSGEAKYWPGNATFGTNGLGDNWGSRNPGWDYDSEVADYLARTQEILQAGTAKVDVAVYNDNYGTYAPIWEDQSMSNAGYSYDFVSENLFAFDSAVCKDGKLDPDGTGYTALVFNNQTYMTVDTANKVLDFLNNGLKVFVIGEFPSKVTGFHNWEEEQAKLAPIVEQIMAHKNTTTVASEAALPEAMKNQGVQPAAATGEPCELVTAHRTIDGGDFYYIYNDGTEAVSEELTLMGSGNVYLINLWSGEVTQAADYTVNSGSITRSFEIEANEAVMVAVTNGSIPNVAESGTAVKAEETAIPSNGTTQVNSDGVVELKASANGSYQVVLGNGDTKELTVSNLPEALSLDSGWNLTVERWEDETETETKNDTRKTDIEVGTLDELVPWSEIPALGKEVAGIGRYTKTVTLPENWDNADGAVLTFDQLACRVAQVVVNGTTLCLDQVTASVDISGLLKPGENTIEVNVASCLGNQLIAYGTITDTWAAKAEYEDYGMIGGVSLTPYRYEEVAKLDSAQGGDTSSDSSSDVSSDPSSESSDIQSSSSDTSSKTDTPKTGSEPLAFGAAILLALAGSALVIGKKNKKH